MSPQQISENQVRCIWPEAWVAPDGTVWRCGRAFPIGLDDNAAILDSYNGPLGEDWVVAARHLHDRRNYELAKEKYLSSLTAD